MPLMDRRANDNRPWGLIVALLIAASAGLIGIPLQVATFLQSEQASKADLERNRQLVEQVRMLEEVGNADVREHRERNQSDHNDLCRLIYEIARQADIVVKPCEGVSDEGVPDRPGPDGSD